MKDEVLGLMKKEFPIAIGLGTGAQLILVFTMIYYAQGGLSPPSMEEEDAEIYFTGLLGERRTAKRIASEPNTTHDGTTYRKQSESEAPLLGDGMAGRTATPHLPTIARAETFQMHDFLKRYP
jgi:hypothetical protein